MIKKAAFTMVEVIIALGILTIAMFTLVGLLPVGLQNSEDTENFMQAPLVAEGFANVMDVVLNGDGLAGVDGVDSWAYYYATANEAHVWADTRDYVSNPDSKTYYNEIDIPNDPGNNARDTFDLTTTFPNYVSNNIQYDPFLSKFTLYSSDSSTPQIYGGFYESTDDSGAIETQYAIRIFPGGLVNDTTAGDFGTDTTGAYEVDAADEAIIFTIEVSWPPQMMYYRRIAMGNYLRTVKVVSKKP